MKHHCKYCGSVLETKSKPNTPYNYQCQFCRAYFDWDKIIIPDYETPQQKEKRTGKPVSDDTAVWYSHPYEHIDPKTKQKTGEIKYSRWLLADYGKVKQLHFMGGLGAKPYRIVIADPPTPPPEDWQMEGE